MITCYIMANMAFVSCTNDDLEDTVNKNKLSIAADISDNSPSDSGGGGQNGQIPVPRPK